MTTQILKKSCTIFMIVVICTLMHSTQLSLSTKCVKHCIMNQCMKVAKKADPTICKRVCKKFCNKKQTSHEKYFVPRAKGVGGIIVNFVYDY
ncbi:hypothetical protein N665_0050s0118 [Sinapis alba]|nr:hypothetical protein N665_0050s0118 [Sinapis alba]